MPKPIVLALDLSTFTGWTVGRDSCVPIYGVWSLGRMSSGLGRIFSCLLGSLDRCWLDHAFEEVIFEAPLPQQKRDTQQIIRLLVGLAAMVELWCFEHDNMPCSEEFPHVVRKLVLGTANVKKEGIMSWCVSQGIHPSDDNAADSYLLWRYKCLLGRMRIMAGAGSV